MKTRILYGEKGLEFSVPDDLKVDIMPARPNPSLTDPKSAIIQAMQKPLMTKPLKEILQNRPKGKICVVISDATRPVPSGIILDALTQLFDELNIPNSDVQLLIATGLHRKSTPEEIKHILGEKYVHRFNVINHVATDDSTLNFLGKTTLGTPIYINKVYLSAAVKILTGYVEPHFFAGFSGGRKSIVPGIAGTATIEGNHSAKNIASDFARFGILEKNPIYEDAMHIAKLPQVKPDFIINVCINPHHQITKVVAGALQAHMELVKYQERLCFFDSPEPYDVIITGNGGYPLDQNLYQSVKSMAIGELGVKPQGSIIICNECRDQIGDEKFRALLNAGISLHEMFDKIIKGEIKTSEQWQIQVLARVLLKADVYVISSLKKEDLGNIGLKYAVNVETALAECQKKYGSKMRVLVLPDGPLLLPKFHMK